VASAVTSLVAFLLFVGTAAHICAADLDITHRAIDLLRENKAREAIAELQQIVAKQPSYFPAYSLLGVAYSQLGKPELAQPYYQKAVNLAPSSLEARINLGANYLALKKPAEAAVELEKVAAADPKRLNAWINLANARLRMGKTSEALEALKRAQELAPDDLEVQLVLAETQLQTGRSKEALRLFNDLRSVSDPRVQLAAGFMLQRNGRKAEAAQFFRKCGEIDGRALLAIAEKTINEGDYESGLALLTSVPPPLQDTSTWHALSGYAHFKLDHSREALDHLQEAIGRDPAKEDYYLLLAEFLGANNAVNPVVTVLESAARALPNSVKIQTALGVAYLMQSSFDKAESILQGVIRTKGPDELTYRLLADSYNRAHSWGKLNQTAGILTKLAPNSAIGWYYRALAGYQLIESGTSATPPETIRKYVATARKLNPDDWRSHVLEGKLLLRDKRLEEAAAAFRRAVKADDAEPIPHYLLAGALRQIGKTEESKAELAAFRRAQEIEKERKFRSLVVEIQRREQP
jgi:tetratricopeptide (TPR) repeat protein